MRTGEKAVPRRLVPQRWTRNSASSTAQLTPATTSAREQLPFVGNLGDAPCSAPCAAQH